MKLLQNWVSEHFSKPGAKNPQNFNVNSYSKVEKENAIDALSTPALGFKCSLENNDNSLKVEKTN